MDFEGKDNKSSCKNHLKRAIIVMENKDSNFS